MLHNLHMFRSVLTLSIEKKIICRTEFLSDRTLETLDQLLYHTLYYTPRRNFRGTCAKVIISITYSWRYPNKVHI